MTKPLPGTTEDWGRTIEEINLRAFPKTVNDGADVTFCAAVFHSRRSVIDIADG